MKEAGSGVQPVKMVREQRPFSDREHPREFSLGTPIWFGFAVGEEAEGVGDDEQG